MYKLLLSWRYLRTRYIALASIVSVTLGVATLVVVNSVMSGFAHEMHARLHGILSDIVVESYETAGMPDATWHMEKIRSIVGADLEAITAVVHVPAMVNIPVPNGRSVTRPINLVGVDEKTYAQVCEFSPHLLHPENRKQLSFLLRSGGYAPGRAAFPPSGWQHRRNRVRIERDIQRHLQPSPAAESKAGHELGAADPQRPIGRSTDFDPLSVTLPQSSPSLPGSGRFDQPLGQNDDDVVQDDVAPTQLADSQVADPFGNVPVNSNGAVFDPVKHQHTGVVLGIAIASTRHRDADGQVRDYYYCLPGDDVQITFPNASQKPTAVFDWFTVVDMYESQMSEYDSTFAFVPLRKLQEMRGMFDPEQGIYGVSSIQLKVREGANLNAIRDKLREQFPATTYPYSIQTWRDLQGPLLAAVQLETTILNILLFLIIAVAGFGILATFFMIVVEKTRDIGILKALGAPSGGVMSIFLNYGFALGVVGAIAGMALGLAFVAYINEIAGLVETLTGREVFDPTVYYFQQIPVITDVATMLWVVCGAVLIAVLASVLPALRAARLHPVEALRHE